MIKLHYSLVDIMDECIEKLEVEDGKQRRCKARPRTQILIPESKKRVTIVTTNSSMFAADVLAQSPLAISSPSQNKYASIDHGTFGTNDKDEFEKKWIESSATSSR